MASDRNGTLYIGMTSNLIKRVFEHKNEMAKGFTKKYHVKNLVYFEAFEDAENAIIREKQLKKWKRTWKLRVIEEMNPEWRDLFEDLCI